jgi:predicted nucleic acid binding AN1-type Zn finger protein
MTETKPSDNTNICQICGKATPSSNMSLHEVMCQRDRQQAQENDTGNIARSVGSSFGKKKVKKAGNAKKSENMGNVDGLSGKKTGKTDTSDKNNENTENLDELLAEFKKKDSQCALEDCKKSILTLGQKCRFCLNVYCLGHHFPEVHGCAQAAKEHARSATGAPKQVSQKAAIRRGHLGRKLESKIKDMEGNRKTKHKDGKK